MRLTLLDFTAQLCNRFLPYFTKKADLVLITSGKQRCMVPQSCPQYRVFPYGPFPRVK